MDSPNIEVLQKGDSVWSLSNIPLLEEYLSVMEDDPLKDVVQAVIDKFKTDVQPKLNFFRKGESRVVFHSHTTSPFLGLKGTNCVFSLHRRDPRRPASPQHHREARRQREQRGVRHPGLLPAHERLLCV